MSIASRLVSLGNQAPRVYLYTTGAGAGAQAALWAEPGSSNFLAGSAFPYAEEETARALGFAPTRYSGIATAVDLAIAAYLRASHPGRKAIGVGCTAKVASVEPHKEPHTLHVATITEGRCAVASLEVEKGAGKARRAFDGQIADWLILEELALAAGMVAENHANEALRAAVRPISHFPDPESFFRAQIFERPYFTARGERKVAAAATPFKSLFYPGSFNPPHVGHWGSAAAAEHVARMRGDADRRLIFTTCVNPPHKPNLTLTAMLDRVATMQGRDFLLTENDPLFIDKARQRAGSAFLIGADVFASMLDPAWGIDPRELLAEFQALGTHFYVVGRRVKGTFFDLGDLLAGRGPTAIPGEFHSLFTAVPGRWDISSSGNEPGTCNATPGAETTAPADKG